tara:strand:- start:7 stop:171 length:165 start_codon:yes stop_codon:yes gene_type:complete
MFLNIGMFCYLVDIRFVIAEDVERSSRVDVESRTSRSSLLFASISAFTAAALQR